MPDRYPISRYFPGRQWPGQYHFEDNRLASFKEWRNPAVSVIALAKAGLHYSKGTVKCCWCSFSHTDWMSGEIPWVIHEQHSPTCPLFTGIVTATNPPNICIPQKRNTNGMAELLRSLSRQNEPHVSCVEESSFDGNRAEYVHSIFPGVNMRSAPPHGCQAALAENTTADDETYPQFAPEEQRLNTFKCFPLRHGQLARLLCYYGFFYSGHLDIVICYFCGLGLCQWQQSDDPKIAHARWSPKCCHLLRVVPCAFINACAREMNAVGTTEYED